MKKLRLCLIIEIQARNRLDLVLGIVCCSFEYRRSDLGMNDSVGEWTFCSKEPIMSEYLAITIRGGGGNFWQRANLVRQSTDYHQTQNNWLQLAPQAMDKQRIVQISYT